jgi:hypothetical protein
VDWVAAQLNISRDAILERIEKLEALRHIWGSLPDAARREEKRVLLALQSQIFDMEVTTTTASLLREPRLVAYLITQSRQMKLPALELGLYALLDCVVACSTREQLSGLSNLLQFGQMVDASGCLSVPEGPSLALHTLFRNCHLPTDLTTAAHQLAIHLCESFRPISANSRV